MWFQNELSLLAEVSLYMSPLCSITTISDVQGEHKDFPRLQTFITLHLRRVSAVDNFPTRWWTSTVGFTCSLVFGCNISNRWVGRDGPNPWPPRSPDITPLHFFLWGYVKDKVFSTPVPDTTNLKGKHNRCFCYNKWTRRTRGERMIID